MMSVRLRLAAMAMRWFLRERTLPADGTSRLGLRCWWTDCDINRHMNNSRYLALMDLGRWHHCLGHGVAQTVFWRWGWRPMAVHVDIDFKRAIHPGQRYELETFVSAVGTKSVTFTQRFHVDGMVGAEAHVVVVFAGPGGTQPVAPMLEALPALGRRLPVLA